MAEHDAWFGLHNSLLVFGLHLLEQLKILLSGALHKEFTVNARLADDPRTWFTRAFLSTSSHGLL
jgi:hypothetical protein